MSLPTPYYDEDGITIYHGDCAELLPSLTGDAVITDPPYGVGVNYGAGYDDTRVDYWPWMRTVVDLMREAAPVVAFSHKVRALQELQGWDWVAAWTKPFSAGARMGNSPILPHWEPIILYGVHTLGTADRDRFTSDVFTFSPQRSGNIRRAFSNRESWAQQDGEHHPVPKPVDLYRALIVAFGGEVTIDPFMGSGTTLRAAKDLGRRAIGIEIEEQYCEIAVQRLAQGVLAL